MKAFQNKVEWCFPFCEYLFFVTEIFTFLYYAKEESDDVIGGSAKTVQQSIKNIQLCPEIQVNEIQCFL